MITLLDALSGYTDNVRTEAYNLKLSERLWMSVEDYVVKKGIDGGRVSGQGLENPNRSLTTRVQKAGPRIGESRLK